MKILRKQATGNEYKDVRKTGLLLVFCLLVVGTIGLLFETSAEAGKNKFKVPGDFEITSDTTLGGKCAIGGDFVVDPLVHVDLSSSLECRVQDECLIHGELDGTPIPGIFVLDCKNGLLCDGSIDVITPRRIWLRTQGDLDLICPTSFESGGCVSMVSTKGNVTLNNVTIDTDCNAVDIQAKHGIITFSNTTITVNGGTGRCQFGSQDPERLIIGLDDPSNHFNCQITFE